MTGDQGWDELTPAERELADYGRSVLAAHFEASEFGAVALPDDEAVYVYPRGVRGGGVLFVAKDRSVLFKGSAGQLDTALAAFRAGERTTFGDADPGAQA